MTPTNLVDTVISGPDALARHGRYGNLPSSLTMQLLAGTVPGVIVGALIRVHLLPDWPVHA